MGTGPLRLRVLLTGSAGSGKTALCVGLVQALRKRGLQAGYVKPVANVATFSDSRDPDVSLMQAVLGAELVGDVRITLGPNYLTRYRPDRSHLSQVVAEVERLSGQVDVLFVESPTSPQAGAALGIDSFELASALSASALMVDHVRDDLEFDVMVVRNQHMRCRGVSIGGNVFNNVPLAAWEKSLSVYKPLLEGMGFPVIGVVPQRMEITAPTAGEIKEYLDAELLAGQKGLSRPIEDIVVGAMSFESALRYLRRATNKAVVTGGDRSDLALAALETSTSVIILTGGLFPNVEVLEQAEQKGVPVLLVPGDTYSTVDRLGRISRRLAPEDEESIRVARDLVASHVDVDAFLTRLQGQAPAPQG
ncbi:MAG: phosphotransacetylase family protein [Limnochordaceae bacterium]|nr:phosphotransacetylase family protein [Limnochordaceae bacterium]